ncbi:ALTERED INHERITANCE OF MITOCHONDRIA PROTEIN 6 [Ceraceosorus bombacis]|uniref:Altered inheritance of mitochondria protein 6 n=1 Tax=Ceraceosorus bombacis TaxID=401625 RepID=A0A0P1BNJ9_9BASI|nr:ALTERED INHERITANCE OF MITOCHONDRIA PROTEIN 6 [Ceraceosorus bombacis]
MVNKATPTLIGLIAAASAVTALKLNPTKPIESDTTSFFGGRDASILQHPADWSRDIQPIGVHSHNDYWRDTPVLDALAHGVRSIESDVWLMNGELYVGHDPYSLSPERTFESLTLAPLRKAIDQANDANALLSSKSEAAFFKPLQDQLRTSTTLPWNGFYTAGVGNAAPIQLLVDLKTEGRKTLEATIKALHPLEQKGYLTTYKDGKITKGPIVVIGTGNTPTDALAALQSRNIFVDCPLGKLSEDFQIEGQAYAYNSTLCGIASTSLGSLAPGYKGLMDPSADVVSNLTKAIDDAHLRGIATRVWDTPVWPSFVRDRVNGLLLSLGSDWINADDLDAIQKW